jgi:hypothetical protein
MEKRYLVWVRGLGERVRAQIWYDLNYGVDDWKKKMILAEPRELTGDDRYLSLDQLAAKYPHARRR